ncbi:hypothetical protein SH1V18_07820 [Vallitalea longa]|uniref:Uncharacterized protein n=1 Tax=Vallitalea longa TaxID=2936439 RepID=A0A9W5Y7W2_9FIRM|nr:hypothetical protein [Vallitalea longa]GKX28302.1 hypothetical protein SH1V18_07820 [Vallitalea longa]
MGKKRKRKANDNGYKLEGENPRKKATKATIEKGILGEARSLQKIQGTCINANEIFKVTTTSRRRQRKIVKPPEEFDKAMGQLQLNFEGLYNGLRIYPYNAEGQQIAKTTVEVDGVKMGEYSTKDQKHAEMRALEDLLKNGKLELNTDGTLTANSEISFETDIPNCGFCTAILNVLGAGGLLTEPSKGKFNLASNGYYPLPGEIKTNRQFWENLTGIDTEKMLDYVFQNDSSDYDSKWDNFIKSPDHFNSFTVNIFKELAEQL